jgi:hypoxanthine-DNA glycosylase
MQTYEKQVMGFAPVFDENSRVLILGSFPSVKSRQIDFYYGNKQNRFWKMLCSYFGEEIPPTKEQKTVFLLRNGVALWDMVAACDIIGSSDASVKNVRTVRIESLLEKSNVEKILLNGALAYELFVKEYANLPVAYAKMPSTSPANPRYDERIWKRALDEVFYK